MHIYPIFLVGLLVGIARKGWGQVPLPMIPAADPNLITFNLYNYRNDSSKSDPIVFTSASQRLPPSFNLLLPTVIFVHGYLQPELLVRNNPLIRAYLDSNFPVNLIIVDWTVLAHPAGFPIPFIAEYPFVIFGNAAKTSRRIAEFILWLVAQNVASLERLHLIGFDLGAHISGLSGRSIQEVTGKSLGRITGLDPSGPFHQYPIQVFRLEPDNAIFVDVIHTNAGVLGTQESMGHVDIWVNGGQTQYPICLFSQTEPEPFCSHDYAVTIYAYSVNNALTACRDPFNAGPGPALTTPTPPNSTLPTFPTIPTGPTTTTPAPVTTGPSSRQNPATPFPIPCTDPLIVGPQTNSKARGTYNLFAAVFLPWFVPLVRPGATQTVGR